MTSSFASSLVEETPFAPPLEAGRHFAAKLAVETDPSDVRHDRVHGIGSFVLLDARSPEAYADGHIPGAVSLHHRLINAESVQSLDLRTPIVAYCWSPACNAGTKAAAKLAALGFHVKEMIGGIEYWRREGFEIEGRLGVDAPLIG
ncbi:MULTISPECIES: rhodanese-like domain-containing protein [unclassified Paenibacillus]|uniref:rhodanese-like domain-containing protein n=1 Tax=unclassified Paenibacillus TaxID=185978 RepID=UPI0009570715|nr:MULTISPECIES: rhodanese-like domain-containing protein [unclassified Paenibacillus]ASS65485.1 rhodanese-like domain-containing protein [Paenibacillus sp. RUD330]SIQ34585.1 Rhodanese-related sulfurtransferase [Paenibacillus sp. RU4X]SIQ56393.1 Rhodanese-related sulfurtransferase [Paenibacillus sp. RU4T]